MNILLVIGLVSFGCAFIWLYFLFISKTVNETIKEKPKEIIYDDVLERCQKLYEQAQSLMESGNEQMAIMHYEAILSIAPYDIKTQEMLAQYYCENGPKTRAIELYEQILMYDSGNINAVETLAKLYEFDDDMNIIDSYYL